MINQVQDISNPSKHFMRTKILRSGAGTILGQGGKTESAKFRNAKQSSSLKLECFFLSQKQAFSKKKKVFAGLGVSFCPKNKCFLNKKKGLRRIRSVFFVPKLAQDTTLRGGAKVAQGGPNYFQRGQLPPLPPTSRAYDFRLIPKSPFFV